LILYDESYNFLGMSEKVLTILGYDDLDEFCTYHKDFAELFEKENGLIYNFENFSWLDFILYGGADKDSAIVKTKGGERFKAKIKVDEIKVKDEILGISKLYSVELKEINIIKEQTKPQNSAKINLSSILEDKDENSENLEIKKENISQPVFENTPLQIETEKEEDNKLDINLSFIKDDDLNEDLQTTKSSFSLDFLKPDTKEENLEDKNQENFKDENKDNSLNINLTKQPKEQTPEEKDENQVVLNFFNSTVEEEKQNPTLEIKPSFDMTDSVQEDSSPKKEDDDKKVDSPMSLNFDFLKKDTKEQDKEELPSLDKTQDLSINITKDEKDDTTIQKPQINIDLLKEDKKEVEPEIKIDLEKAKQQPKQEESNPLINLNFLNDTPKQEDQKQTIEQTENKNTTQPSINLNFLKQDSDQTDSETKTTSDEKTIEEKSSSEPLINLNFLNTKEDDKQEEPTAKKTILDVEEGSKNKESSLDINLNFLKEDDDTTTVQTPPQESKKDDEPLINLNFLKESPKETTTPEKTLEIEKDDTSNNQNMINISLKEDESNKEETVKLDPEEKSKIIMQIKEDINEIDKNETNDNQDDIVINNALKSILNIQAEDESNKEIKEQEHKQPKEEPKPQRKLPKIKIKETKQKKSPKDGFNFLSNLNITLEDKKVILRDFINDATYNLVLIQKYLKEADLDSIKFLALKIKSSAEVLDLDDIASIAKTISYKETDIKQLDGYIEALNSELNSLKTYL